MKELKRVIAFAICLVIAMSCFAFADTKTAVKTAKTVEPTAVIVSPADGSISESDSLLVSVKINKAATIKVTIYEEKIENKKIVTNIVSGTAVTREAISYTSVDTSKIKEDEFFIKSEEKGSSVATSAAATAPAIATYVDKYYSSAYYTNKDALGFYTAQENEIKPGIYKVLVETIEQDELGKDVVKESTNSLVVVKEKPAEEEKKTFTVTTPTKEKTSALSKISNFFKSLFK